LHINHAHQNYRDADILEIDQIEHIDQIDQTLPDLLIAKPHRVFHRDFSTFGSNVSNHSNASNASNPGSLLLSGFSGKQQKKLKSF